MGTAASSSLRGSSVPGLPLMVLGGLLHRSRSWRGAVLTLHSLVGLLYRPVVASHLPRASGSPRHQSAPSNARACPGAGPHALTIIRIKKPGLNRLYCGGVSECTMSKNLTWPAFNATRGHLPHCRTLATLTIPTGHSVTPAGRGGCPPSGTACPVIKSAI
jgi:hypothetical protein